MANNAVVYAIRSDDVEETARLVGKLFGVGMEVRESEVWDDCASSDYLVDPLFSIKRNNNRMEPEIGLSYPEFPDHELTLEIENHPDLDAVDQALTKSQEIDAVLISREEFDKT